MNMRIKEKIKIINNNFLYKTLCASIVSLTVTFIFTVYNTFLGIKYSDSFAIGISIYYFLLIWLRSATLLVEKKIFSKNAAIKTKVRIKNYSISSILIFIIDFCLIAPMILMVTQPKDVKFGIIPAIAMAAYSVYKITFAIINYVKSKKTQNLTIILFREINIIEAIVSILTLQHTLIMVNGGMDEQMKKLSFGTSIALIGTIIVFSILSFHTNRKLFIPKT